MLGAMLGLCVLATDANAQEGLIDARADRKGSVDAVVGTTTFYHFLSTQFYVSDRVRIRMDGVGSRYPEPSLVDWIEENGNSLGVEANSFWSISLLPGAYYALAQFGDDSSAFVVEAGASLMIGAMSGAETFRAALEDAGVSAEGNSSDVRAIPSIGVAYIKNSDNASFEAEFSIGPVLPVWGNMAFGIPELDGVTYGAGDYMSSGVMNALILSYRGSPWIVGADLRYSILTPSVYEQALCEAEGGSDPMWCESDSEFLPFFGIGASFGP